MKSYRELEIYIESKRLAIHKMSLTLPMYELFEEGGQIRRSSKSITAMIVEGYCRRRYKPEFIKYLVYAQSEYDVLSKKINKFIQWVEDNLNDFPDTGDR